MEKENLLKSVSSWEKQLPTPYAFKKLMSTFRRLGKIEKRDKNFGLALEHFNRVLSLSMIWHAAFGPKTSGISGWQVDEAEGYLKALKAKFGTIYPYSYSEHGPVQNDVVLSATDYKNVEFLTDIVGKQPSKKSNAKDNTQKTVEEKSSEFKPAEEIISGRRVAPKKKGKAKYVLSAFQQGTVEQLALRYYKKAGHAGLWSENDYWWQLFAYLYWDVIFAKIRGVYDPRFGPFPGPTQDMSRDLFQPEFYSRRRSLFKERDNDLSKKGVLSSANSRMKSQLVSSYNRNQNSPCRLVEASRKFKLADLKFATRYLTPDQLLPIMRRLYESFNENRSGIPDLLIIKDDKPAFIEVKRKGERIAPNQMRWMEFLNETVGIPVSVCRVHDE